MNNEDNSDNNNNNNVCKNYFVMKMKGCKGY